MNGLQEDLNFILYCLKTNQLSLKSSKTKVMCTASQYFRGDASVKLTLDNVPIEHVDQYKYLGLVRDPRLNFIGHIDNTVKKGKQTDCLHV